MEFLVAISNAQKKWAYAPKQNEAKNSENIWHTPEKMEEARAQIQKIEDSLISKMRKIDCCA